MRWVPMLGIFCILAASGFARGVTPSSAAPPAALAGPKNQQGLSAAIVVNKAAYLLNAAQSGKEFRDRISALKHARGGGQLPQTPAVDLTFRITNTTDAPVTISLGGDDSQMDLALEGPGAISADNMIAMTMEFRVGTPVTIAPGQAKDVPIRSLSYGMRGVSKCAYWTEAGDYTIAATLTYGDGDKQGTVASGPAKVKVTKE